MQTELMRKKHYDYLERTFDIDRNRFAELCDNSDAVRSLVDDLLWKECDAVEELDEIGHYSDDGLCAIELIDILCGPYDPVEINGNAEFG